MVGTTDTGGQGMGRGKSGQGMRGRERGTREGGPFHGRPRVRTRLIDLKHDGDLIFSKRKPQVIDTPF